MKRYFLRWKYILLIYTYSYIYYWMPELLAMIALHGYLSEYEEILKSIELNIKPTT